MLFGYALFGFILGVIVGFFLLKYGNKNIRNQNQLKKNLVKNQEYFINHQLELQYYFSNSIKLLENLTKHHHDLYQYTLKSSKNLLLNKKNSHDFPDNFIKTLCNYELSSDKIQPRDYPLQNNDNKKKNK
ncbi:MAG: DUF1043 family protein [Wigglesworthia glossinidia]|nr:DUF1043 family protein [Wigglesworthia glossinidia]